MASNYDNLDFEFNSLSLSSRKPFRSVRITRNLTIVENILKMLATKPIDDVLRVLKKGNIFVSKDLPMNSTEYNQIATSFRQTQNVRDDRWNIVCIKKVFCPYLLAAYLLMKQKKIKNGATVKDMSLYHGTDTENLVSICKDNFDRRFVGKCGRHKFGQGVSFATRSTYACHYPEITLFALIRYPRVLIQAQVMVGKINVGTPFMTVPPEGCDTTSSKNLDVIVKYDDAEFFPEYLILYNHK